MTVCIIPARAGSKRIKNKNIKLFHNKPLISYAIKTAKLSGLFSKIVVTTDSVKIANIAKKYGAITPFIRNKKLSGDYANTFDVLADCILKNSIKDTYFFCLYPTTPLLEPSHLKKAFKKIKKINFDGLVATKKFESSPFRAFECLGQKIRYLNKNYALKRSQDLKKTFYDSGTFYIFKTKKYLNSKGNLLKKTTFLELDRFSGVDINTNDDFKFASDLYKIKNEF